MMYFAVRQSNISFQCLDQYDIKTFNYYKSFINSSYSFTFEKRNVKFTLTVQLNYYNDGFNLLTYSLQLFNTTLYGSTFSSSSSSFIDSVIFDQISNTIRVIQITKGSIYSTQMVVSCQKDVKKDTPLIEDLPNGVGLYVTSKEYSAMPGYFIIMMAATVQNPIDAFDRDFYVAYFDTKYNVTMWYRQSNQSGINETVRGLHYNSQFGVTFIAVEVNANYYLNASIYDSFADKDCTNKSSIAIIAFDQSFGNRKWVQLLGSSTKNSSFKNMGSFGNNLYILIQIDDLPSRPSLRTFNLAIYSIRIDTGMIVKVELLGGIGLQDLALDIQVNYKGVWVMAQIGNYLCQQSNCNSNSDLWYSGNSAIRSFAMILLNHNLQIVDIEGYLTTDLLSTLKYIPTRFFLTKSNSKLSGNEFQFIFLAQQNDYTGLYFTVYQYNEQVFSSSSGCPAGCTFCDPVDPTYCLQCLSTYTFRQGACLLTSGLLASAPYFTTIDSVSTVSYQTPCHYSCAGGCTSPTSACTCNAGSTFSGSVCICSTGTQVDADGVCAPYCSPRSYGLLKNRCLATCPYNSLASLDFSQSLAQLQSSPRESNSVTSALTFQTQSSGIALNVSSNITSLPASFTLSFWVIKISDGSTRMNNNFDILSAFGKLFFQANATNPGSNQHSLYISLLANTNVGGRLTLPSTTNNDLSIGTWVKVAVSVQELPGNLFNFYFMSKSSSGMLNTDQLLSQSNFYTTPFSQQIYLGIVTLPCKNLVFPGSFKEIAFFSEFHSLNQMKADTFRYFRGSGFDQYTLLAYYPLNSDNDQGKTIEYELQDYSESPAAPFIAYSSSQNTKSALFATVPALALVLFDNVALCYQVKVSSNEMDQIVMRGDFLAKRLSNIVTTSFIGGTYSLSQNDRILICKKDCRCLESDGGETGRFSVASVSAFGSTIDGNTIYPPLKVPSGAYYEVCYSLTTSTNRLVMPLGQIYIVNPPDYIYPFNYGVYLNQALTFEGSGQDVAYRDQLYFCSGSTCQSTCTSSQSFSRLTTGKFASGVFDTQGQYLMCYQSAYTYDQGFQQYLQVNGFNYFIAVKEVYISDSLALATLNYQSQYASYNFDSAIFVPGDYFQLFSYSAVQDCDKNFQKGSSLFLFNIRPNGVPYFPPLWFGTNTGVTGITTSTNDIQICYFSSAILAQSVGFRIESPGFATYHILINQVGTGFQNYKNPEISYWFTSYAGTVNSSVAIEFGVYPYPTSTVQIYPCQNPTINQKGSIAIRRMAVGQTGSLVASNENLWAMTNLTDSALLTIQSDLNCSLLGKCLINMSQVALVPGEIYQVVLYSYSFMVKSAGIKYYLFGTNQVYVTEQYAHTFFVRGWDLYSPTTPIIGYDTTYLKLEGWGLKYQTNVRVKLIKTNSLDVGNFTTYGVNASFYISNAADCSYTPFGTVLLKDVTNTSIEIRDFSLNGCTKGSLYANIYLWRGIFNPTTQKFTNYYVTNKLDMYIGELGCDPVCARCNGSTSSDCLLCADYTNYYLDGTQCVKKCPSDNPYFQTYKTKYNKTTITAKYCMDSCPESSVPRFEEYSRYGAVPCYSCLGNCEQCSSNKPNSCLVCSQGYFLYQGGCLENCPDLDLGPKYIVPVDQMFQTDYSTMSCILSNYSQNMNSSEKIQVKAVPSGYRYAVPSNSLGDKVIYFKAGVSVQNGVLEQMGAFYWKQLTPFSDWSALDFSSSKKYNQYVFEGTRTMSNETGYLKTMNATQKMRMASYSGFQTGQLFQILIKGITNKGILNYDLIEYVINSAPVSNYIILKTTEPYHNKTMSALFNLTTVNKSASPQGWYDIDKNEVNNLYYRVYVLTSDNRFLIKPFTYQQEAFLFRLPFLSNQYAFLTIKMVLDAQDVYAAQARRELSLNVTNSYNASQRLDWLKTLTTLIKNGSLYGDTYYQLLVSNVFESSFDLPVLGVESGVTCIADFHCSNGGTCTYNDSGRKYCQCLNGFTGGLCQYLMDEVPLIQQLTNETVNLIENYFEGHTFNDSYINGDLEFVVMIMRGFLKSYETITIQNIETGLNYMLKCLQIDLEVGYTFNKFFYDDYFIVLDRVLGKVHYDLHLLQSNMTVKKEQILAYQTSLTHLMALHKQCLDLFVKIIHTKINYNFDSYSYTGNTFMLFINRTFTSDILTNLKNDGLVYISFGDYDVQINAYKYFLEGLPPVNSLSDLRLKFIKYIANPFIYNTRVQKYLDSPLVQFEIADVFGNVLPLNLSNVLSKSDSKFFEVIIPYEPLKGYDESMLTCQSYNETLNDFIEGNCGVQVLDQYLDFDGSCQNCTYTIQKIAICYCTSLSIHALIFKPTSSHLTVTANLGIYTDYYGMNYWSDSFGFLVVVGSGAMYFIGIGIAIALDIGPKKRLKHKLLKDFRHIGAYGLRPEDLIYKEEKEEIMRERETEKQKKKQREKKKKSKEKKSKKVELKQEMKKKVNYLESGHLFGETKPERSFINKIDENLSIFDSRDQPPKFMKKEEPDDYYNYASQLKNEIENSQFISADIEIEQLDEQAFEGEVQERELPQMSHLDEDIIGQSMSEVNEEGEEEQREYEDLREEDSQAEQNQEQDSQLQFINEEQIRDEQEDQQENSNGKESQREELEQIYSNQQNSYEGGSSEDEKQPSPQSKANLKINQQLFQKVLPRSQVKKGGTSDGFNPAKQPQNRMLQIEVPGNGSSVKKFKGTLKTPPPRPLNLDLNTVKSPSSKPSSKNKKQIEVVAEENDATSNLTFIMEEERSKFQNKKGKKKKIEKQKEKSPAFSMNSTQKILIESNDQGIKEEEEDQEQFDQQYAQSPPIGANELLSPIKLLTQSNISSAFNSRPQTGGSQGQKISSKTIDDAYFQDNNSPPQDPKSDYALPQSTPSSQNNFYPHEDSVKNNNLFEPYDQRNSTGTNFASSIAFRPTSKLSSNRTRMKTGGMTRVSELTHADDNDRRYLRKSEYTHVDDEIKDLKRTKEEDHYTFCSMLKHGNPILNLIMVDSLLFPRHARWTLLFMNIILIWFFCAVIYNAHNSPLSIPDLNKNASSLAFSTLWIAAYAPWANMILMYLFAALFKVPHARIQYSSNYLQMKSMFGELQKEMNMRYILSYFISFCVFSIVSWYIVTFTSNYGWKVSWAWFYNGCCAFLLNFVVFDFLIVLAHYLMYKTCRKCGLCIAFFRNMKQAREEA